MILLDAEVIELIKNPKNSKHIKEGTDLNKASQLHFTGEGYKDLIEQLIGWETAKEYNERKGLGSPVTMKQTNFIYKELTRWQNNNEINCSYDFGNDVTNERIFKNILLSLWNQDSIDKFRFDTLSKSVFQNMNDYILLEKPAIIIDDPNNVIVNCIVTPISKAPKFYITLLSSCKIIDVKKLGNNVEYIIYKYKSVFNSNKNEYKRFRCLDSTSDRIFIQDSLGNITLDSNEKIFIYDDIPVKQIGTEFKEVGEYEVCVSPINHAIPMMDRYVKFDAINIKSEVTNAFPKWWTFAAECPICRGQKTIDSGVPGEKPVKCSNCNGLGRIPPVGNGEPMLLPSVLDDQTKAMMSNPAGIIQTDVTVLTYQSDRLSYRDLEIIRSCLGEYINVQQNADKTATEITINIKPLEDRNRTIAENVEYVENWICNYIGKQISKDFKGYSINIPKKLNILDENSIIKQIEACKKNGLPISHIKELNKQLLYSVYRNDKLMLNRQLVLLELEPLTCYTMDEIKDLKFVTELDKIIKQYFADIISTVEFKKGDITKFYQNSTKDVVLTEIKNIAVSLIENKEPLLIDTLGVGGTQALQAILSDTVMDEQMKRGILLTVFGLTSDKINIIFKKKNTN